MKELDQNEITAGNPWVILAPHPITKQITLVKNPGLDKPWSTYNESAAKEMARNFDGKAYRAREALEILMKNVPSDN